MLICFVCRLQNYKKNFYITSLFKIFKNVVGIPEFYGVYIIFVF